MNLGKLQNINNRNIDFKLLALTALFFVQLNYTYSQCDTMNCNNKITGSFGNYGPTQKRNNFYDNLVPCWEGVYGTPHLVSNALSSPSAAMIYSYYWGTTANTLEKEAFGQHLNLLHGHRYILSYNARRDSAGMNKNGSILVSFKNGYNSYQLYQCNCGTTSGLSLTNWTKCSCCFTAPTNIDFISFESRPLSPIQASSQYIFWSRIDDAEIWEIKAQAGPDTLLCDSSCIWLGKLCANPTLHINRQFEWTIAGNPNVISTQSRIQVCPTSTTTYVLRVSFDGYSCQAFDTVKVTVSNRPTVNLGNDTIICGPIL